MGKKSAPPPPDYQGAAEKQAAGNQQAQTANVWAQHPNEVNPWGSSTWQASQGVDPTTGKPVTQWANTQTLTPELQAALTSQMGLQQGRSDLAASLFPRAQQEFGQAVNWSQFTPQGGSVAAPGQLQQYTQAYGGAPNVGGIDTSRMGTPGLQGQYDFGGLQGVSKAADTRQRAEDAIYGSAASRLDPQWQARQASMESDLANKGISMNSDAYQQAMAGFGRDRNDAYQQALMGSITGGGAEAQRDYGMDIGLRQQQAQEAMNQGNLYNQAATGGFNMGNTARNQQLQAQQSLYDMLSGNRTADLGQQQQAFEQAQQAQGTNFSNQMAASQYQNQLRDQQIQEMMARRGFSLNELNSIISGQQVQMPGGGAGGGGAGGGGGGYSSSGVPDYMTALQNQYGANADAFNAKQAQGQATTGAVGGIAAAAIIAF